MRGGEETDGGGGGRARRTFSFFYGAHTSFWRGDAGARGHAGRLHFLRGAAAYVFARVLEDGVGRCGMREGGSREDKEKGCGTKYPRDVNVQ